MTTSFVAIIPLNCHLPKHDLSSMSAYWHSYIEMVKEEQFTQYVKIISGRPVWHPSDFSKDANTGVFVQVSGSIYNPQKRLHSSDLLDLYLKHGTKELVNLSGIFVLVLWDPREKKIFLINDRFGFQKLYIYQDKKVLIVGTELKSFLGLNLHWKIDEIAVSQYLITSHLLGNRSLISGISLLPPASIWCIQQTRIKKEKYWDCSISSGRYDLSSFEDLAHKLSEKVVGAVSKMLQRDANIILPCTAGMDSRFIAAALSRFDIPVNACTFGHPHCYDVRYGRKIARTLGFAHQVLPVPENFFSFYMKTAIELNDGEIPIEGFPMMTLLNYGERGDLLFSGFLGDTLSGSGCRFAYEEMSSEEEKISFFWQKRYVGMGCRDRDLERILIPNYYAKVRHQAFESIVKSIKNANADSFSEKSVIVDLYQRQRRFTAYQIRTLGSKFRVCAPFTDQAIIDFWLSIPLKYRVNQLLYRAALRRSFPKLFKIGIIGKEARKNFLGKTINIIKGRLPMNLLWRYNHVENEINDWIVSISKGWLGRHDRKAYVHHDHNIRVANTQWFRKKLNQHELTEGWFDPKGLNDMLDQHVNKKQDHSIRINNIISFLEWRKLFNV